MIYNLQKIVKELEESRKYFPDGYEINFTTQGVCIKRSGFEYIYIKYEDVPDLGRALLLIAEEGM